VLAGIGLLAISAIPDGFRCSQHPAGTEAANVVAVAGHNQVLENGPEIDTAASKQQEHGDVLEGMYTLARIQMSAELAEMARMLGRAGGRATVSGKG
jgi:hypothetical protein